MTYSAFTTAVVICLLIMVTGCGSESTSQDTESNADTELSSTNNEGNNSFADSSETQRAMTEQLLGIKLVDKTDATADKSPETITLTTYQQMILKQQVNTIAGRFDTGDVDVIMEGIYSGRQQDIHDLLLQAELPMKEFAKAVRAGRLVAATDVYAEYEIIIEGKAWPVVFLYANDRWYLFSF